MKLGDIIASKRRKKRITSKAFSQTIGISSSLLSKIENNKVMPSSRVLKLIAENLETTVPVLFLSALEDKHFSDREGKKLFFQLQPVVADLLSVINDFSDNSED